MIKKDAEVPVDCWAGAAVGAYARGRGDLAGGGGLDFAAEALDVLNIDVLNIDFDDVEP